jgi:hypothetical protein
MRIRQALPRQQRRIPESSPFQYSAPTELQTRHSEFKNLVGLDSGADRCRPRKRGRSTNLRS